MPDVIMVVERIEAVPRRELPAGFSYRTYREGDRETWTRIHAATHFYDPLPQALHARQFGDDEDALAARQIFVVNGDGQAVATATAWFNDPAHGVLGGRVHWVAVVPSVQRRGIASALLGRVCDRIVELGDTAAYLTTDAGNSRAIALYQGLGFRIAGGPGRME